MLPAVALVFALGLGTGACFGANGAAATTRFGNAAAGQSTGSTANTPSGASKPGGSMQLAVTPEIAYDLVEANGEVESLGGAAYYGSAYGTYLTAPVVAIISTPDLKGYWLIGADATVYPFGDARNEGGAGGSLRADPVVAAAATPDGDGYWLVTSSGKVMAFGDAVSYGSITQPIRAHVVGIVATPDGRGYWIACNTGGVFNFGDAAFHGSAKARTTAAGTGSQMRTAPCSASATRLTSHRHPRLTSHRPLWASASPLTAKGPGWRRRTAPS
jgi:hypothetical protein